MGKCNSGMILWSTIVLLSISTNSYAGQAQVHPEHPPILVKGRELHGRPSIVAPDRAMPDLSNSALKLTDVQKSQIDGIISDYLNQEKVLHQQVVMQRTIERTDGNKAKKQLRQNFNVAVSRVLNASQRKVWEDSLAKRGFGPDGIHGIVKPGNGNEQATR